MSSDATTVLENTKWLSFLCSSLNNMRHNNVMCDMSLIADDGDSFPCHMSVLAASSPILYASVCGATERPYNMKVAGMTGHVLGLLLQFVYSGNVTVTKDVSELTDVIKAAGQLQLTHITGTCEELLREVQVDMTAGHVLHCGISGSDPTEIELVPECWLTESGGCFWPPFKNVTKAIKSGQSPEGHCPVYRVHQLCTTATYEIGHQMLPVAEYMSDVSSDQGNEVSKKRGKKPTSRYTSDEASNDDEEHADELRMSSPVGWSVDLKPAVIVPEPYQNTTSSYSATTPANLPVLRSSTPTYASLTTLSVQGIPHTSATATLPAASSSTASVLPTTHPTQRYQQAPAYSGSTAALKSCAVSPFEVALVAVVERLVQQVEHNGAMVAENRTLVQQFAGRSGMETTNTVGLPTGVTLPITSREELHAVEAILQDKVAVKQTIGALSFIGGTTIMDTIRRIMAHIMTNYTAKQCNWKGKNNKVAFSKLALWEVLSGAVRRNLCTRDATDTAIECVLKQWLRFAADRDGGRQQREQRRRELMQQP